MKTLNDLLLLGDPRLYEVCEPVKERELDLVKECVADLDNVMTEIRARYNFGRAIAAPQLGIVKRLIYMKIHEPVVYINPEIIYQSPEKFEVWDDCMCFPNLLVRVERHKSITVKYLDEDWYQQEQTLEDDLSELFQHEYDHLNGILCTMRAIDNKSFRWRISG
jgi:peptide deformylase